MKAQEQMMIKMSDKIVELEIQSKKVEENQKKEHTHLENKMLETTKKVGEYIRKFDEFEKYVKELNE